MIRVALASFILGALALAVGMGLGAGHATDLARAALSGWLVASAAPLGALPILMALDLAGRGAAPGTPALRLVLAALPPLALLGMVALATILVAPGALDLGAVYGWDAGGLHGVAAAWFQRRWFAIRGLVYLAIWIALAVTFVRPVAAPASVRLGLARLGLALHLVIGSLAALDWVMSLDLALKSAAFGLLLLTLQGALAAAVALALTLAGGGGAPRGLVAILLCATASAGFVQFTQYLVVWSANPPPEIPWYAHRLSGLGGVLSVAAPLVALLAVCALLPERWSARTRWPAGITAGLLIAVGVAELLWLVTPSWRGVFTVSALDGLALIGLGGIAFAIAGFVVAGLERSARHG